MARICVFGDSITWGSWDPDGGGWVQRLYRDACRRSDLLGNYQAVHNLGVSGDRLSDVARRLEPETKARMPSAIVIAVGTNDVPHGAYAGTPLDDFTAGYALLLYRAKSLAMDVVAVTPPNVDETRSMHDYRNADLQTLVEIIRNCAEEQDVPIADVFGTLTSDDLRPDGLHPGPEGHEKLYKHVAPVVFDLPSLRMRR